MGLELFLDDDFGLLVCLLGECILSVGFKLPLEGLLRKVGFEMTLDGAVGVLDEGVHPQVFLIDGLLTLQVVETQSAAVLNETGVVALPCVLDRHAP